MKRWAILSLLVIMTLFPWSGHAQESGERKRIRVVQGPARTSSSQGAATAPTEWVTGPVIFKSGPPSDVRDLLAFYAELTGLHLIHTDKVQGSCPLILKESMPKAEALGLIEKALFANGFALISSNDPKTLHVTGIGESSTQFPVPVFTKLEELPESERVVKMVFKVRHRDVDELAKRFTAAYPAAPYLGGQSCAADPKSGSLVVTERTSTIREMARLIEQLDVPPPAKRLKK